MHHIVFLAAGLFVMGFVCFAAFSWGVKGHFRSTGKMPPGMRLISALSLAGFFGFVAQLASCRLDEGAVASLGLFAASLGLFVWTVESTRATPPTLAFDNDKPSFLLRHGPYRYVRHPFYLSYMLFWTGTAVAFPDLLSWLMPVVMVAVYAHAAGREERKFQGSELSGAYAAYRRQAGMFLPRGFVLRAG
jgi:protein-S-isoprenylcysteine O-methyltransferase Ste14